jgi:hypothetical protein
MEIANKSRLKGRRGRKQGRIWQDYDEDLKL